MIWVSAPHYPRPRPIPLQGKYRIEGETLIQTGPPHVMAFAGLGLDVTHSRAGDVLTSQYAVRGGRLTLKQPASGKSAELQLAANALPPSRQGGAPTPGAR